MDISDLIIDKEFESVIPPLDEQEFEFGHHRYKILKRHPYIKYRINERSFVDRYDVIDWICLNQLARRNLSNLQKTILIGKRYNTKKKANGASDGFRGNQNTNPVLPQNEEVPEQKMKYASTAKKIAEEMGVSHATVERSGEFVDGMEAAEEVLPGVSKDIASGKIKPKQADVRAIAKAPAKERKQMAENLYKELTPDEKKQRKEKREFTKALQMLDATHMPSEENKITPEDMLMTFQSEVEKVMRSMDFCFDYFPELLTEKKYISKVQEIIKPLKDYIKNLEDNIYEKNII